MNGVKESPGAGRGRLSGRVEPASRTLEAAAADTLRRGGGALPVERLRAELADSDPGREGLRRCLSGRGDLFLVLEPPRAPWSDQEDWTRGERAEYGTAEMSGDSVLLVDGSGVGSGAPVPLLLRESLLTMWREAPDDDTLRRELGRAVSGPPKALRAERQPSRAG